MTPEQVLHAYVGAFVDELSRAGVRDVVVCPGSRSTPLALSLADHRAVKVWMHYDERSAAFFALGMAKARRAPVGVLCTSGTAAANFMPAVVEAHYGRVPLLVLTADRPPELQEIGAPQTIDQSRMYGQHAKWFAQALLPEASVDALRYVRTLVGRAVATARGAPAGPVHLNLPFREPLIPLPGQPPAGRDEVAFSGRPGGQPYVRVSEASGVADRPLLERLAGELAAAGRGLVVCGPQEDAELGPAAHALAAALGWPLLADPLSGARTGEAIDAYDALLRAPRFVEAMAPDLVVRLGAMPTSKPVLQYLQRHAGARQIVVDDPGGWQEPTGLAAEVVHADASALCRALASALAVASPNSVAASDGRIRPAGSLAVGSPDPVAASDGRARPAGSPSLAPGINRRPATGPAWLAAWREANARARAAIAEVLAGIDEPFEGKVFAELADLLPDRSILWAGSSMPVRDLDTFFPALGRRVRLLSNRGANGIDGVVSSALGAAAASDGRVVLAIGDLSFYHDMNGLLAARLHALDATVVLLNNDGGGIFSFLPQASHGQHFEALFGTPHGLDFRPAVEMYGGRFERATTWPAFRAVLSDALAAPGLSVVEVPTDRARNVDLHRRVWPAVAAALRDDTSGADADADPARARPAPTPSAPLARAPGRAPVGPGQPAAGSDRDRAAPASGRGRGQTDEHPVARAPSVPPLC